MFRMGSQRPIPADDQPRRVIRQKRSAKRRIGLRVQPAMRDGVAQVIEAYLEHEHSVPVAREGRHV